MRHNIFILCIITLLLSCGQSDTKQKELELREREVALKEKELALKESDTTGNKTKTVTTSTTTEKTSPVLTPTTTVDYNYAAHSNFQTFWSDFKKAVNAGDKNAVVQMTNIPFKDNTYENGKTGRLSASSAQQFLVNYDKIFTPSVIKAINANKYRGWTDMSADEIGSGEDVVKKGEYLLEVFGKDILSLAFSKKSGRFKLSFIPYYS